MRTVLRDFSRFRRHATQWRVMYRRELPWHKLLGWFGRWRRALPPPSDLLLSEQPWMSFAAIDFLERRLQAHHQVFEWGMGGSTPFLARRAGHVVSVEHDAPWFESVQNRMRELALENWTPMFIGPGQHDSVLRDPADWTCYATNAETLRSRSFRAYAHAIEAYSAAEFDFVIVDGRARPSCFMHGLSRVKPGGFLLWDDSDRAYYQPAIEHAASAELVATQLPGPQPHAHVFKLATAWQRRA